ncbi:MAG TPA: zinc-dependent metalloprotease [Candidatus Eremiobacteraceae bacterium]|nr:zinc-dependent metalloprotease [Candidatus Eremiobacteraceae bacterium]
MIRRVVLTAIVFVFSAAFCVSVASAAPAGGGAAAGSGSGAGGGSGNGPAPYADFVQGATVQNGLFPIVTKDDKVYLVISASQLGKEFIETSVPNTGLGGFGPAPGEPYVAPARTIEFDRVGGKVIMRWPNTNFTYGNSAQREAGVKESFPNSVIAVVPISAEDASTGSVVVSASPFLGDVAYFEAIFQGEADNPEAQYRLDPSRTFFMRTAAFPTNDLLQVSQTWASSAPDLVDNAPDARSLEVHMEYNLIAAPNDGYRPRIADDRVGYFTLAQLDFGTDQNPTRQMFFLSRWNFEPATPGKPSVAQHPLVFTLSKDVPNEYRAPIKAALLTWNDAFKRVGILNAIQVQDQPDDPSWDPEDMRHNMVRWFDSSSPQYGAEALIVNDPRTGEEINAGINIDSVVATGYGASYTYWVAPTRGLPDDPAARKAYAMQNLRALVLHESGHDMGLQHNFIGSMAYTARDLQSKAFTDKYGVSSSVMEYAPVNLWPKGTPQGDYAQLVLGPYDYHAIDYGYSYITASTPQQELPTLRRIASQWADPHLTFASDEDVSWPDGHAIDPRVQQFDLSNDPLNWCGVQMKFDHADMNAVASRFPRYEQPNQDARNAFGVPFRQYARCADMTAHVIGGEYLSRGRRGDPGEKPGVQAVPRSQEARAWGLLDQYLFSDSAWHYSPAVLTQLTYTEQSTIGGFATWAYNPGGRHDIDVAGLAGVAQDTALSELFAPLTLSRLDALQMKYAPGQTMSITDLFDWAQNSIYGDIANGRASSDGVVMRNLQARYAKRLGALWTSPQQGTPDDARALARLDLEVLRTDCHSALARPGLDELTRAHLEELDAIAGQALNAQAVIR